MIIHDSKKDLTMYQVLADTGITLKAKGVIAYLSEREGEHVTLEKMVADMHEGIASVRAAVKELEESGYLERVRDNSRGYAVYDWILLY